MKLAGSLAEYNLACDTGKWLKSLDVSFTSNLLVGVVGTNFARFFGILSAALATGEHEKIANGKSI